MRKLWAALALAFLAACAQPPVTDEVTVEFYDGRDEVLITAETKFDLKSKNPRVDAARNAALVGTDAWSARFTRLAPELDQVTFERHSGALARVVHAARIPAEDLQRVFSDTAITVSLVYVDGQHELTLYPGTSTRATREQHRHFEDQLGAWSKDVARYFTTIDHLYDYMNANPHRAEPLFAAMFGEKGSELLVMEEEVPLLEAVEQAMEKIGARLDATEARAASFAEEADLIYNPFPARMIFRVPREKDLVIEPIDLFSAIAALEGKWISPDPLAALLKEEVPSPAELAEMERKSSSVVDAGDITRAIREQLVRPRSYVLRWRD